MCALQAEKAILERSLGERESLVKQQRNQLWSTQQELGAMRGRCDELIASQVELSNRLRTVKRLVTDHAEFLSTNPELLSELKQMCIDMDSLPATQQDGAIDSRSSSPARDNHDEELCVALMDMGD